MTGNESTFLQQQQCLDSMEAMCSMSICTRDAEPGDGTPPRDFFCGASEHSNLSASPLRKAGQNSSTFFPFCFRETNKFRLEIDNWPARHYYTSSQSRPRNKTALEVTSAADGT